jgi:hypothetical protein
MENSKIFNKYKTKLEIEKLKDQGSSLLNLLSMRAKKEITSICLYKSDLIISLSDGFLIQYDITKETQILEINVIIKNKNKI